MPARPEQALRVPPSPDVASWLAVGFAALAGGFALGCLHLLRRPLPTVRGAASPRGLSADVEVIRDRWGVPHIYAETLPDLMLAQGYVHAQDRFWQMESIRRVASGMVAEVVGKRGLPADRFFRRLGFRRAALAEATQLDEDGTLALDSYAAGVNAYLAEHARRLPVEFRLLRYAPAPWSDIDTLTCGKLLGWALSSNWDTELFRARLIERIGAEAAADLEPSYPLGHPLTIRPELDHFGVDESFVEEFREARELLGAVGSGAASNAWAIDGARSATGKPLLANDPHLEPQIPGFWHESHLVGAGLEVTGVTVPGVLGIVVGHNRRIAWGTTVSLADTQDLYVERANPANPRQYEHAGRWEDARVIEEVIHVRRSEPIVEEVHVTRHGPVVSPALDGEERVLSLRCSSLEPTQPCAILDLDRAASWDDFRRALSRWQIASLSFVYADVDGNIGYQLTGRIPIRARSSGLVPVPGWTGEHEWQGYVPWESMPHVLNPRTHYVVSANNRLVPDGYPYHISHEWADGFRARRIRDLLVARERHDVESFQEMQSDLYSLAAAAFREHMLQASAEDEVGASALSLLRAWDCRIGAESAAAALYEVWRFHLLRNVFGEKLGDEVVYYLGLSRSVLAHTSVYKVRVASHLLRLLRERPASWFGSAGPEASAAGSTGKSGRWPRDWDEAIQRSFREAVTFLRATLGDDPRAWRWGDLHQLTFRHVIGASALGRLLNRGPFPVGGDSDTICQAAVDVAAPFLAQGTTVSYRMIADLADFDRSVAVLPCGQSGHPGSRHYADQLLLWRRGGYHPMPFSRGAVLSSAAHRLVLRGESGQLAA